MSQEVAWTDAEKKEACLKALRLMMLLVADDRQQDTKSEALLCIQVPTTFNEMFLFNAAVMGFGQSTFE